MVLWNNGTHVRVTKCPTHGGESTQQTPMVFMDLWNHKRIKTNRPHTKTAIFTLFVIACWCIWKERNQRIFNFNFEAVSLSDIERKVLFLFCDWTSIAKKKVCEQILAIFHRSSIQDGIKIDWFYLLIDINKNSIQRVECKKDLAIRGYWTLTY